ALAKLGAALFEQAAQDAAEMPVLRRGHAELAGQCFGFERMVVFLGDCRKDLRFEIGHLLIIRGSRRAMSLALFLPQADRSGRAKLLLSHGSAGALPSPHEGVCVSGRMAAGIHIIEV